MINKLFLKSEAEKLNIFLSDEMLDRFDIYADFLVETNKVQNLTRITAPDEIVIKHFVDSFTVFCVFDIPENAKVADIGTGAGFPGVVMKIARPDIQLTLIDSLGKRISFLDELCRRLGISAEAFHLRAEEAGLKAELREKFDVTTARAVAKLNVLCEYCLPLTKVGGAFISMKGPTGDDELGDGSRAAGLLGGAVERSEKLSLSDGSERQIIVVRKQSETAGKYPRHGGKISKSPL